MIVYRNILVIQTAFIGDAILASSLIEKIHAELPEASVSLLVRKGNQGIYEGHPFLKEVLIWDKSREKTRNLFGLLRMVRKRKFDCVINCHRYLSSGLLTAFSGARHKTGFKQTPFAWMFDHTVKHVIGNGTHETERYVQLVSDFLGNSVHKPKLYPSVNDEHAVLHLTSGPFVCMAPASVWQTKQLPEEKWISLCSAADSSLNIYLLGGKEDAGLCERIATASGSKRITVLAGKLSLLQSCALMRKARMNYVNDSAPLHLASSVNAPVTAFFCSTVPQFGFGPLSEQSRVVEVNGLSCRPCGLHGKRSCPKGHFDCGNKIDLSEV